ncbi:MAG: hypothetical protein WCX48_10375 [Bacteroidales bacterium]
MDSLNIIRLSGAKVAFDNKILGLPFIESMSAPEDIAKDFIDRIKDDLLKFNTVRQFDHTYFNLFVRAFMYAYGKGAEYAFFIRTGNMVSRIDYDFDKTMHGKCGENLPDSFRFELNAKSSVIIEMYVQMFRAIKDSHEQLISEGLNFEHVISVVLSAAFFWGQAICCTVELSEVDKSIAYQPENDKPYDSKSYTQNYKPEDFQFVNTYFCCQDSPLSLP